LPRIFPSVSDIFPALDLKKSIHFDQKGVFLKKRVYDMRSTLTTARVSALAGGAHAPSQAASRGTPEQA
jgi:hypothetical protein